MTTGNIPPRIAKEFAVDEYEKRAREVLDQWADDAQQEALMSLDPEYLKRLEARGAFTCAVKEHMIEHVAAAIKEAVAAERAPMYPRAALPSDIDPECRALCEAMNELSGIQTYESCCGHGEREIWVFFCAQTVVALGRLIEAVDCEAAGWKIEANYTNSDLGPVSFLFIGPCGDYAGAEKLAAAIRARKP